MAPAHPTVRTLPVISARQSAHARDATAGDAAAEPAAGSPVTRPSAGTRLPKGLAAFSHRDYRIFWFVQLGSLTGTWMQSLAQSWLVLTLTNSPFQLGLINVCQFGPSLLLGLPAGVVADRVPKRRLLFVTQSGAFVVTALLAFSVATGRVQLWQIYAAALGLGIANAVDMPTRQAFVTDMVGKDDLMNAVALNSALFNTTRVLGPAIAGLLLAQVGAAVCFVLNAASYVPVLIGLLAMRTTGAPAPEAAADTASPVDRLRQGFAYVRSTRAVLLPIVLVGVIATFGMNFNVWVPLLAQRELGLGADGFGLLLSSLGVGSLAGALLLAFRGRRPSRRRMLVTAIAFGGCELLLALAATLGFPLAAAMALLAAAGFAMSTTMALANTTVQTTAPDALRGRVMSIYMTVFAGTAPLGALVAGAAAGLLGTPGSIALGGGIVILAAVGLWIGGRRSEVGGPVGVAGAAASPDGFLLRPPTSDLRPSSSGDD
jgi:MFS family permease